MGRKRKEDGVAAVTIPDVDFNLRELADQYEDTLRRMIRASNQLRAHLQGHDLHSSVVDSALAGNRFYKQMARQKALLELEMADIIVDHPVYEWAMGVPGLNRVTICRIVGLIPMYEPEHFFEFTKLTSFAGYAPGKDRLVRGQKATFSQRLKTAIHVADDTVRKCSSLVAKKEYAPERLYGDIYKAARHTYAHRHGVGEAGRKWCEKNGFGEGITEYKNFVEKIEKKTDKETGKKTEKKVMAPEWSDGRQHLAARRKSISWLLSHLWMAWRINLGWTYRPMYFHEVLHHEFEPDLYLKFSSPELAARKKKAKLTVKEEPEDNLPIDLNPSSDLEL